MARRESAMTTSPGTAQRQSTSLPLVLVSTMVAHLRHLRQTIWSSCSIPMEWTSRSCVSSWTKKTNLCIKWLVWDFSRVHTRTEWLKMWEITQILSSRPPSPTRKQPKRPSKRKSKLSRRVRGLGNQERLLEVKRALHLQNKFQMKKMFKCKSDWSLNTNNRHTWPIVCSQAREFGTLQAKIER